MKSAWCLKYVVWYSIYSVVVKYSKVISVWLAWCLKYVVWYSMYCVVVKYSKVISV